MEKITTYLCGKLTDTMEYEPFDGDIDAIEIVDGTIKTALWPDVPVPGCQDSVGKITTRLLKGGDNRYFCFGEGSLTWQREEIPYGGSPVGLEDYITIEVDNSDHCHWIQSLIKAHGADDSVFGRIFGFVDVGSGGQDCPDDKADVFSGGGKSQFRMTQNQIVPGELIELRWIFWDGQHTEDVPVSSKWLCTCCFTGGRVISVNGDYGDVDITYTVEIQGVHTSCVPSDFVEYEVDDWVFVLVPSSTCSECGRKTACKGGCDPSDGCVISPMRVGNYGT